MEICLHCRLGLCRLGKLHERVEMSLDRNMGFAEKCSSRDRYVMKFHSTRALFLSCLKNGLLAHAFWPFWLDLWSVVDDDFVFKMDAKSTKKIQSNRLPAYYKDLQFCKFHTHRCFQLTNTNSFEASKTVCVNQVSLESNTQIWVVRLFLIHSRIEVLLISDV